MSTTPAPSMQTPKQEDRSPTMWAIIVVFTLLPQIAVALRVLARRVTHQSLWWDDWLVIAAALFSWFQFVCMVESIYLGMGRHQAFLPPSNLEPFFIWTYASEIWYAITVTLVKCSILCLYIRLFRIKRGFARFCYGMIVFVLAWFIGILASTVFQCSPVRAAWVKTPEMLARAKCVNLRYWLIGNNVPNILADFIMIIMPLRLIWDLKLSIPRKLGLCLTFVLAFTTTTISIVRVVSNAGIKPLDVTWQFCNVGIYSTTEGNIGIVCACLPVLAPLTRMLVGKRPMASSSGNSEPIERGSNGRQASRKTVTGSGRRPSHPVHFSRPSDASDMENLWSDQKSSSAHGKFTGDSFQLDPIVHVSPVISTLSKEARHS